MKSGRKSSRSLRILRKCVTRNSRCCTAALRPSSLPYSRRMASGHPDGSRYRSGSAGSASARFRMPAMPSRPPSGGKSVMPSPRISPMVASVPLLREGCGFPSGAMAELRRDLLARLPHMALEVLEVVGEAGARPRDAHGGDTLTVRVEKGGRHRREVRLALATVDRDAGAADLLKLAPEVGRPHDRRWSRAPHVYGTIEYLSSVNSRRKSRGARARGGSPGYPAPPGRGIMSLGRFVPQFGGPPTHGEWHQVRQEWRGSHRLPRLWRRPARSRSHPRNAFPRRAYRRANRGGGSASGDLGVGDRPGSRRGLGHPLRRSPEPRGEGGAGRLAALRGHVDLT